MLNKILSRTPRHAHTDPAERIAALTDLAANSDEVKQLLRNDSDATVRGAAALRCADGDALLDASSKESDATVQSNITQSLGKLISQHEDESTALALLNHAACSPSVAAAVAAQTLIAVRRGGQRD